MLLYFSKLLIKSDYHKRYLRLLLLIVFFVRHDVTYNELKDRSIRKNIEDHCYFLFWYLKIIEAFSIYFTYSISNMCVLISNWGHAIWKVESAKGENCKIKQLLIFYSSIWKGLFVQIWDNISKMKSIQVFFFQLTFFGMTINYNVEWLLCSLRLDSKIV